MKKGFYHTLILILLLNLSMMLFAYSPSRERGAIVFMNYCSGCHTMQYLPWSRMNQDLHLAKEQTIHFSNLVLSKPDLSIIWPNVTMSPGEAQAWFMRAPPDLSLVYKQRGQAWLIAYLHGFYQDSHRPFGVSNKMFLNVGMPNVLETVEKQIKPLEFSRLITDIVSFLEYASEPAVMVRYKVGALVLSFLILFCLLFWWQISKMSIIHKSDDLILAKKKYVSKKNI